MSEIKSQPEPAKIRRKTKIKIKPSLIAIYASVFTLVIAIIFIGYSQPVNTPVVSNAINVNSAVSNKPSVDQVVATDVALVVAQAANLPIAPNIAELAVSTQTQAQFDQANNINSSKPQIIGSENTDRSIITYVTKEGDTVDSLASVFKISKDTIKFANNLVYDSLSVGKELRILPVDGIIYTVKSDDSIDSIASKYQVDKTRLVLYNDLDISGLVVGSNIILPNAVLPNNERPGYVPPVVVLTYAGQGTGFGGSTWNIGYGTPGYAGNTYAPGNCTRYAYDRRIQLGLPVSSGWGNAISWAYNAARSGLSVDRTPSAGAIIQNGGGLGHVAIVESILPNGDLSISEMNAYVPGGGWNIVSGRTVAAGNVSQYLFIH